MHLKKAYDSMPRDALWVALGKTGVPEMMIQLIRSFHQDMRAQVRLDGVVQEEISVLSQTGMLHGTSTLHLSGCGGKAGKSR